MATLLSISTVFGVSIVIAAFASVNCQAPVPGPASSLPLPVLPQDLGGHARLAMEY